LPRVLQPLAGFHTRVELLGRALAHPLLVAPMAWQRMAHADGEIAMAHAAAAQGAGLVLSTQASQPLEAVSQAFAAYPEAGPLWFQLYLQADRGFTRQLVQRAEAAGYQALVLTVDAPVQGARDRERRAGFRLPPGISAVNLDGHLARRIAAGHRAHLVRRAVAAGHHPAAGAAQGRDAPR
jgi:4-hydroxymandelate oxidase